MAQTPLQSPQDFAHCSKLQRSYCTKTHPTPHNSTPDRNWGKIKMALLFHYLRSKEKLTRLGEKKGKPNPAAVQKINSGSAGCTAQTHLLWPGLHILPPGKEGGEFLSVISKCLVQRVNTHPLATSQVRSRSCREFSLPQTDSV